MVQTALHWAAKSGQLEVVKLVAGCGVDVNAKSVSFAPRAWANVVDLQLAASKLLHLGTASMSYIGRIVHPYVLFHDTAHIYNYTYDIYVHIRHIYQRYNTIDSPIPRPIDCRRKEFRMNVIITSITFSAIIVEGSLTRLVNRWEWREQGESVKIYRRDETAELFWFFKLQNVIRVMPIPPRSSTSGWRRASAGWASGASSMQWKRRIVGMSIRDESKSQW